MPIHLQASIRVCAAFTVWSASLASAGPIAAQCLQLQRDATNTLIWSFPANAASDVPLDVAVQLIAEHAIGPEYRATINGRELSADARGQYPTGGLDPDTDYRFELTKPSDPGQPPLTIEFHTGAEVATSAAPPHLIKSWIAEDGRPHLTQLCAAVFYRGRCADTISPLRVMMLSPQADVVAWALSVDGDSAGFWPEACAALFTTSDPEAEPCYELQAVSANGSLSAPTSYCPGAGTAVDTSCSVAQPGSRLGGHWWAWSLVASALVLSQRRRSRRLRGNR